MAISNTDLISGIDPTGFSVITGAQLAQLVNASTFNTDKGCIIVTVDANDGTPNAPDPAVNAGWTSYMWLRVGNVSAGSTAITAYVWNPNITSVALLLKWTPITSASLAINSVEGSVLIDNTVTKAKILGQLDASQVVGLSPLTQFLTSGGAVTAATGAILISNGTVTPTWTVKAIVSLAEPTAQAYDQVPYVPSGGVAYALKSAATFTNKVVQYVAVAASTAQNQGTTPVAEPVSTNVLTGFSKYAAIGDVVLPTPTSGNKVKINAVIPYKCTCGAGVDSFYVSIYDATAAVHVAFFHVAAPAAAGTYYGTAMLQYYGVLPSAASRTYNVYFGSTTGTAANFVLDPASLPVASIVIEELLA